MSVHLRGHGRTACRLDLWTKDEIGRSVTAVDSVGDHRIPDQPVTCPDCLNALKASAFGQGGGGNMSDDLDNDTVVRYPYGYTALTMPFATNWDHGKWHIFKYPAGLDLWETRRWTVIAPENAAWVGRSCFTYDEAVAWMLYQTRDLR